MLKHLRGTSASFPTARFSQEKQFSWRPSNQRPWQPDTNSATAQEIEKRFGLEDITEAVPSGTEKATPRLPWQQPKKQDNPWSRMPKKRRVLISIVCVGLVLLLGGGALAAVLWQNFLNPNNLQNLLAGPPDVQISIDAQAMNAVLLKNLKLPPSVVSNLQVVPMPNNALKIQLDLNVNANGIHRTIPIEIDSILGGGNQPDNIVSIQRIVRGGVDAGPEVAAQLQATLNQFMRKSLPVPGSNSTINIAQLGKIRASDTRQCGHGSILLHLGLHLKIQPGQVAPVGVDSYIGLDQQRTLLFHLERITRDDGKDVGASITAQAKQVVDQILNQSPSFLDNAGPIKQIKLLSLGTSNQSVCGQNTEMLVLRLGPAASNNARAYHTIVTND